MEPPLRKIKRTRVTCGKIKYFHCTQAEATCSQQGYQPVFTKKVRPTHKKAREPDFVRKIPKNPDVVEARPSHKKSKQNRFSHKIKMKRCCK